MKNSIQNIQKYGLSRSGDVKRAVNHGSAADLFGTQCRCTAQHHILLHQLVSCFALQLSVLHRLLRIFGSPEGVWNAGREDLARARVRHTTIDALFLRKSAFTAEAAQEELLQRAATGMTLLCMADKQYPVLLQRIAQPPIALYVRGDISYLGKVGACNVRSIAIVGSRSPSEHGLAVTRILAQRAAHTECVVSGLALGVDVTAHEAVLDAQATGKTVAVLGGGITDTALSPARNKKIAQRIIQNGGALISEYPFNMQSRAQFFPERNRIIAGMCSRILVIEAAARSGSLITARHALEENRDVLAVPGELLNPKATGTNALLAAGAQVIYSIEQFTEILAGATSTPAPHEYKRILKNAIKHSIADAQARTHEVENQPQLFATERFHTLTESQQNILRVIVATDASVLPATFSNLLDLTALAYEELQQELMLLELSGYVTRELSGEYSVEIPKS